MLLTHFKIAYKACRVYSLHDVLAHNIEALDSDIRGLLFLIKKPSLAYTASKIASSKKNKLPVLKKSFCDRQWEGKITGISKEPIHGHSKTNSKPLLCEEQALTGSISGNALSFLGNKKPDIYISKGLLC